MGNINWSKVLIGGVVAGILFLVFDYLGMLVMGFDMEAWAAAHSLVQPPMWVFIFWDIVLGIMAVWLYAAIRPRFGAGVRTAAIAAAFIWLFFTLTWGGFSAMGLFEQNEFLKMAAWGIIQVFAATLAGAWLYKEGEGAAAPRM